MRNSCLLTILVIGPPAALGCAPDHVSASSQDTSAESTVGTEEDAPADLPSNDPRWCIEIAEGAETRMPVTEVEYECSGELTAEACEANPACTAVFGRPVQCPESGACLTGGVEFLGCIPFTICKMGGTIYCREFQGYLLTYASMQGTCTPFGMTDCVTSPDYAGALPPDCE